MNRYVYFPAEEEISGAKGIFLKLPEAPEDIEGFISAFEAGVTRNHALFAPRCQMTAYAGEPTDDADVGQILGDEHFIPVNSKETAQASVGEDDRGCKLFGTAMFSVDDGNVSLAMPFAGKVLHGQVPVSVMARLLNSALDEIRNDMKQAGMKL